MEDLSGYIEIYRRTDASACFRLCSHLDTPDISIGPHAPWYMLGQDGSVHSFLPVYRALYFLVDYCDVCLYSSVRLCFLISHYLSDGRIINVCRVTIPVRSAAAAILIVSQRSHKPIKRRNG